MGDAVRCFRDAQRQWLLIQKCNALCQYGNKLQNIFHSKHVFNSFVSHLVEIPDVRQNI